MNKQDLIEELLHNPLEFSDNKLEELILLGLNFHDIRACIRRIYDLSEGQLRVNSNANTGLLGKLNHISNSHREKQFFKKIVKQKKGSPLRIIYAEGDSWFQFPVFIRDIIDWLKRERGYAVYSEASGGDWLTNMVYEGQYIPSLSVYKPEIFLISGGGNDFLGGNRLAIMVTKDYNQPKYVSPHQLIDPTLTAEQKDLILEAQHHITKEFYAFIWIMKAQFILLFSNLYAPDSTQNSLICITQGYDYAIPHKGISFSFRYPLQFLLNCFMNNGLWLYQPLMIRGIFDTRQQKALITAFIYEFNQMHISIARRFANVYHIDCRGVARNRREWFDELHYKSHVFRRVAKAYRYVFENYQYITNRVIVAKDL
jgi:hypothetical protein